MRRASGSVGYCLEPAVSEARGPEGVDWGTTVGGHTQSVCRTVTRHAPRATRQTDVQKK